MQKYAGTIITWLICQQAIQEQDRELYTYALYNMVLLIVEDFTPKLRCGVWLFPVFIVFVY